MVTGGGSVPAPAAIGGGAMAGSMVTSTATPTAADSAGVPPPRRTSENRRSNKPIMEKRRRARINNCLNELKTLILDAMKKDPARHSKLEKADILEMTVKHLENLQRQQAAMTAATDPTVLNKFRAGFSECATEVGRFPGLESPVRRRLLQHLANCLNGTVGSAQQPASKDAVPTTSPVTTTTATPPPSPPTQQLHTSSSTLQVHIVPSSSVESSHHQVNSSSTQAAPNGIFFATTSTGANGSATGLQLVPTRLPNGDIALVLPTTPTTAHFFRQVVPASSTSPATSPAPSSGSFSSASSSSSSPLPMLIPIPSRTSSNSSSSSSMSSAVSPVGFDRLSVRDAATSPKLLQYSSQPLSAGSSPHHMHHQHSQHSSQQYLHPNVESLSVEPPSVDPLSIDPLSLEGEGPYDMSIDRKPLMAPRSYSPPLQKPLALVIKKRPASDDIPEEKPWRPW